MSVAPQPIGPPLGTPQGTVAQFADIQRAINELKANAYSLAPGGTPADRLVANSITAAQIQAGTITSTEIAASTITAGNLNVATLSAITADMGSLTSGSLSVASGVVTVSDALGITITQGVSTATTHNITWINGSFQPAALITSDTQSGISELSLFANSPDSLSNAQINVSCANTNANIYAIAGGWINTLNDINGRAQFQQGVGFWGASPPGAQPPIPSTLADVIAIIRGCGLSL